MSLALEAITGLVCYFGLAIFMQEMLVIQMHLTSWTLKLSGIKTGHINRETLNTCEMLNLSVMCVLQMQLTKGV